MRLIDADAMIEDLKNQMKTATNPFFAMFCDNCIAHLEKRLTAYDAEAVVAELENIKTGGDCRNKCKYYDWSVGWCEGHCEDYVREKAIEIVRNGGKEGAA